MSKDKNYLFFRSYLIYIGFVIIMGVVMFKTIKIQLEGKKNIFSDSDERIPYRTVVKYARKGDILDRNFNTLLTHVPYYDIYMDPTVVQQEVLDNELNNLASGLHEIFPSKSTKHFIEIILNARENGNKNILLARKVSNEQKVKLQSLPIFELGRFKGGLIDDVETIKIEKPFDPILTRTLGDNRGIGIYGAYQKDIEGIDGEEIERKFANGWKKIGQIIKQPVKGSDIISSIDKEIQEVAHSELNKQIIKLEADHGSVIVMEVKTGYIRAIANLKRKTDGTCSDEYNYAIGYGEVPGSTLKLASLMAGFEDGKFNIGDSVNAKGTYYFPGGNSLEDSNNGYGYGKITIQNAFEVSSNVIADLIYSNYKDEPERFLNQLQSFGLLDRLGVVLKGEAEPIFPRPGGPRWDAISLPWMSIGYSVLQTPLQTLAFYNAVANNGAFMKPQFVEGIKRDGQEFIPNEPIILKQSICSENTLSQAKICLEGVMLRGTGKKLKSSMFSIAGKTGTAKILNNKGNYGDDENKTKYQASFVGYFPADDPIYSCIVVISEPNPEIAYYGSVAAGSVFSEVADKIYATAYKYHKAINESTKIEELPKFKNGNQNDIRIVCQNLQLNVEGENQFDWVKVSNNDNIKLTFSGIHNPSNLVPDVKGMNAKDAIYLLEKNGLVVIAEGYGSVESQSMNPGEPIIVGKQIKIKLENP